MPVPSPGQLEHRAVSLDRLELAAAEDEPRPAERLVVHGTDDPAARHAEVAAKDEAALEGEEQVLADRLHALEPQPVDRGRDAGEKTAWMRRFRLDDVADERLEPGRRSVKRIPLGHGPTLAATG